MARRTLALLIAAVVLAGCGSKKHDSAAAHPTAPPRQQTQPRQTQPKASDGIPAHVPRKANGRADPQDTQVIRAWLVALRKGDTKAAARYFALPSKVQNAGTPVLTLRYRADAVFFNETLTCGARAEHTAGAGRFTIVTFRLTQRVGGDCGTGIGITARGAIRVAKGLIAEWYRLPDLPGGGGQTPQVDPGSQSA